MTVLISGRSWKRTIALFVAVGAVMLALVGEKAHAQAHNQWREKQDFKNHQKMERRNYGNSAVLRDHQRAESPHILRRNQRR